MLRLESKKMEWNDRPGQRELMEVESALTSLAGRVAERDAQIR